MKVIRTKKKHLSITSGSYLTQGVAILFQCIDRVDTCMLFVLFLAAKIDRELLSMSED